MITCQNCGTQNVDGVRFCVQCGTALAPPPESWRDPDDINRPLNAPSGTQPGTGGYTPPYATPPPPPPPPSFSTPLPAMSYGTHGASGFGKMQYAEWVQRIPGYIVDSLIGVAIYAFLAVPFAMLGGSDPNGGVLPCLGVGTGWTLAVGFQIYNLIYLRSTRGSSIGQGMFGLKTVTAEGELPSTGSLVIRLIAQVALGFVPCIGVLLDLLFPLWDEKKQTLHDKAASTFVIKT